MPKPRVMELTPELVDLCFRVEAKGDPDPQWTPMSDGDYRQASARLAARNAEEDLWVFAYGSLIWKPAFETVEAKRMTAHGWHRSFCLELQSWRGTPEQPGLMMALERGGQCQGVAYRLPKGDRQGQIERMLRRELEEQESIPWMRWLPVQGAGERHEALSFWVGPFGKGIRSRQPLEAVAQTLARACGHIGSGAEYLYNTVLHLESLGIRDRNLWRLQQLVAEEIRLLHPR